MKKILYITNIARRRMDGSFCGTALAAAHEMNLEFHIIANRSESSQEEIKADEEKYQVYLHHADIVRLPYSKGNIDAYKQIVNIIRKENIDYIHCNTPIGGVLGRLAGKKCKVKKVIYMAHGFHFGNGAPLKNWILYYPIERLLAHYTDALITINSDDYALSKKFKLRHNGKSYYVHGVGADVETIENLKINVKEKRETLGFTPDDYLMVSVGELSKEKNQEVVFKALKALPKNYKYVICGEGAIRSEYEQTIKEYGIEDRVFMLGYRTDVIEILKSCDLFVFPSKWEGLPRAIMEAMAAKIPIVCSKTRGNKDLIRDERFQFKYDSPTELEKAIKAVQESNKANSVVETNYKVVKMFSREVVTEEIKKIYQEVYEEK